MIKEPPEYRRADWQTRFVEILPEIESRLRQALRHLSPEARDDSMENGIVHCMLAYSRLFDQRRAELITAASLVWYAVLQIQIGRLAGCPMNSKEPLSRYAQLSRRFKVLPLHHCDPENEQWINDVIASRQASIVDQVAIKLDFVAWLGSLCRRTRSIATDLARGFTTSEVGRKYRVSPGRVSQVRRELQISWREFQKEPALAAAT